MYLHMYTIISINSIFIYVSLCIGTEVYMGEAGQDMYIDTIGMYV